MSLKTIEPKNLKEKLDSGTVVLIDVREPHELDICKIDKAVNIPSSELESRFGEIPKESDVVVMCRSGGRAKKAIEFLESKGYTNLTNLQGGILSWIDDVDQSLQKY